MTPSGCSAPKYGFSETRPSHVLTFNYIAYVPTASVHQNYEAIHEFKTIVSLRVVTRQKTSAKVSRRLTPARIVSDRSMSRPGGRPPSISTRSQRPRSAHGPVCIRPRLPTPQWITFESS